MGGLSSRFFGQPQFQVVVMGLDNAGKTTMLHTMKNRQGGQIEMTIPTVGLNVKTLEFQGSAKFLTLQAFDPWWSQQLPSADETLVCQDGWNYIRS